MKILVTLLGSLLLAQCKQLNNASTLNNRMIKGQQEPPIERPTITKEECIEARGILNSLINMYNGNEDERSQANKIRAYFDKYIGDGNESPYDQEVEITPHIIVDLYNHCSPADKTATLLKAIAALIPNFATLATLPKNANNGALSLVNAWVIFWEIKYLKFIKGLYKEPVSFYGNVTPLQLAIAEDFYCMPKSGEEKSNRERRFEMVSACLAQGMSPDGIVSNNCNIYPSELLRGKAEVPPLAIAIDRFSNPSNYYPMRIDKEEEVRKSMLECVQLLAQHGANINRLCDGKSIFQIAALREAVDIMTYLLFYAGAKLKLKNQYDEIVMDKLTQYEENIRQVAKEWEENERKVFIGPASIVNNAYKALCNTPSDLPKEIPSLIHQYVKGIRNMDPSFEKWLQDKGII